jgi:hypothetical protein
MSVDSKTKYARSKSKEAELHNGEFLGLLKSQMELQTVNTSGLNGNQFGTFGMNIDANQMKQLKSKPVVADPTYLQRDYRQLGNSSTRKSYDSSKVQVKTFLEISLWGKFWIQMIT